MRSLLFEPSFVSLALGQFMGVKSNKMGTYNKNKTLIYVIAIAVIVLAFFLLGGGDLLNGSMHHGRRLNTNNLRWGQIIISLIIGFVLGLFAGKRKW